MQFDVRRYTVLREMVETVSFRSELGELFRDLAPRLRTVVPFDFINFSLFHSARNLMQMYLWDMGEWPRSPVEMEVEKTAVGWAWRNQTVVAIDDLAKGRFSSGLRWLHERALRSYCVFPLTTFHEKLGALGFSSRQARAFSYDDIQFLHRAAEMVALCIDRTLDEATLAEEKARLRLLFQVGALPLEPFDLRRSLASLLGFMQTWAGKDRGGVYLYDDAAGALRLHTLDPQLAARIIPHALVPIDGSLAGQVFRNRQSVALDHSGLMGLPFATVKIVIRLGVKSVCLAPIFSARSSIGVLMALSHEDKPFLPRDAELLEQVAGTIAPAFERGMSTERVTEGKSHGGFLPQFIQRLASDPSRPRPARPLELKTTADSDPAGTPVWMEESLRDVSVSLRQEKKRLQILTDVGRALSDKLDVSQVFPIISASLRRVLLHEYASLALRDENSGRLSRQAMDFPLRKGPVTLDDEIAANDPRGQALLDHTPRIFGKDEIREFPAPATEYLLAEGLRSLCCVPLLRPRSDLGLLVLGSTRADAFKSDDLVLVNQVASQLAIALENARSSREVAQLKNRAEQEKRYLEGEIHIQPRFEGIVGESEALAGVMRHVQVVAGSDATVMILGETGTGKGLIARAIHNLSKRSERGLINMNCAAIPTGLVESELFGHEKGAFTGAISQKIGRLELADHGTLFLDEIGEIPLEMQPKLLRVLQDHEFERLGGTRTIKVDIRLIAATNRELARSVAEKQFRSDLFYRLNVFPIHVPSLRERREDIPLLVRYFVQRFSHEMNRQIETIPRETMQALVNCDWPGNVRELENFIERSVILTSGAALRAPLAELKTLTSIPAEQSLQETERQHIVHMLRETKGVIAGPVGAARRLGLKRSTLQSRMQRLGITRDDYTGHKSN
jgi:formate hydrogenlyase transcriptional activator